MAKKFLDMANDYVSNCNDDEETKEGGCNRRPCDSNNYGEWNSQWCQNRQKWGERRAVILKKPEDIILGEPGQVVFAEIEVQNNTKWPWKRGCYLGMNVKDVEKNLFEQKCPIKVKDMPID